MKMINPAYINADGFVTVQPNAPAVPGEGNGWLQTGLAYACGLYPQANADVMLAFCAKSNECPLIYRSPHKKNADDNETCDDYWAALPMSQFWAKEVLQYARAHGWNFDVQEKGGLEYAFWRFPAFTPFLKLCAGESLNIFDRLRLAGTIAFDAFFSDAADTNMAAFCRLVKAEQACPLSALAAGLWRSRIRKRYGTIGKSWAGYFGDTHPLVMFDA
jgi:hypothetical protein